jgi:hypothetical protein
MNMPSPKAPKPSPTVPAQGTVREGLVNRQHKGKIT